jgi:hypothetical protein
MNIEITDNPFVIVIDGKKRKTCLRSKNAPYLCVNINGKIKSVHRLIAETYIPNPNNLPQVNHINGIKTDNRIENLEWVSVSDNVKHRYNVLNKKHNSDYLRTLTNSEVKQIRIKYIPRVYTMEKLSKEYNVSKSTICRIINENLNY